MSISIVNSLDEKTWRSFVDDHPQANIFHTPEMTAVFSKSKGHKPVIWAAVDGSRGPVALFLPVEVTLRNGIFYPWTTRAVAYGSILCSQGKSSEDGLIQLLNAYSASTRGRILFTELRNFSSMSDCSAALKECNFAYEDHLNYLVDLQQSEEELWHRLSKSCRQRIRIARTKGTTIDEVCTQDQLIAAYRLLKGVYARAQVPLVSLSLFQAAYDICGPLGMFKVFTARLGDRYIGSAFILMYKRKILAWYSASDKDFAAYNPGELLKWHSFLWGKQNGYQQFDFGGAGKPTVNYGPRQFKAKFGGELVNFGRYTCIHSPIRFEISKLAYSAARKVAAFSL